MHAYTQNEEAYAADAENAAVGPHKYYADGITPPARNIVRRKFLKARPPLGQHPRAEVSHACADNSPLIFWRPSAVALGLSSAAKGVAHARAFILFAA